MAPFVSRAVYERECRRADAAEARVAALEASARESAVDVHELRTRASDAWTDAVREGQQTANALARAEKAEERADYLLKQVIALKKKGFDIPPEPKGGRVVPPGPSPEALAERRMHDSIVESIAHDIEQMPGIDPSVARVEAQRLRDEALGKGTVL